MKSRISSRKYSSTLMAGLSAYSAAPKFRRRSSLRRIQGFALVSLSALALLGSGCGANELALDETESVGVIADSSTVVVAEQSVPSEPEITEGSEDSEVAESSGGVSVMEVVEAQGILIGLSFDEDSKCVEMADTFNDDASFIVAGDDTTAITAQADELIACLEAEGNATNFVDAVETIRQSAIERAAK